MKNNVIEVKNISKRFDIERPKGGYVSLRDVLAYNIKNPLRFLKRKTAQVTGKTKEPFWALRDISFNVAAGEVVGIIGKNGAGKSTLLKILTGITPPTHGEILMRGKISSLLEVGTGFHPELTGRENIFLNGAVLGMSRSETASKFDEIVEFAGVGKFLDTPVKYYSSGMYVRLAFSVAAHMEPDILLVDEVLAVGDAEFQKKCLGKMQEVTSKQGRTILFVSHTMSAVQSLCTRCILIKEGKVEMIGETKKVIDYYLKGKESGKKNAGSDTDNQVGIMTYERNPEKIMQFRKISLLDKAGKPTEIIRTHEPLTLEIEYEVMRQVSEVFTVVTATSEGVRVLDTVDSDTNKKNLGSREVGMYRATVTIPPFLNERYYQFSIVFESGQQTLDKNEDMSVTVVAPPEVVGDKSYKHTSVVLTDIPWTIEKI